MIEFTIIFNYEAKAQKAGVMKSAEGPVIEYDVRPAEPDTVHRFGKQIIIYKEGGNYNSGNHLDESHISFFNTLVAAIREQDQMEIPPSSSENTDK